MSKKYSATFCTPPKGYSLSEEEWSQMLPFKTPYVPVPTLGPFAIGRTHEAANVSPGAEKKKPGKELLIETVSQGPRGGRNPKREGFPSGLVVESACQYKRSEFDPWSEEDPTCGSNKACAPRLRSLCSIELGATTAEACAPREAPATEDRTP